MAVSLVTGAIFLLNDILDSSEITRHKDATDLWTILTLAAGLAAYTSTILIELRKAITQAQRSNSDFLKTYEEDYAWLVPVDFLLIAISLVVILTIILKDASGRPCSS